MNSSKKWNGKSVYQLNEKLRQASEVGRAAYIVQQQLKASLHRLDLEAAEELIKLTGWVMQPGDIYLAYSWDCPGSPTAKCVYNTAEDPMKDICLFCEDPLDRG